MQKAREVVTRAIEFNRPDRLPLEFGSLGMSDIAYARWKQIGTGDKNLRESYDEWGCLWVRSEEKNMGQILGHPLDDWAKEPDFSYPDPEAAGLYDGLEEQLDAAGDKYVVTSIFMLLFERLHGLRGFENTLTDLYLEREKLETLADRIVEYDLAIMENLFKRSGGRINGFTFTDDWGTERAAFISTEMWDDFFKPRYRRIFHKAREYGWHVWMHSCGKINELIPSLIEIGVNVLNLQQPRTNGIEELGRRFAGKVCFSSLCDIQHTLPFEDAGQIRDEARDLLAHWATDEGGFILSDYGDGRAIGVEDDKKRVMLDAFLGFDRWARPSR